MIVFVAQNSGRGPYRPALAGVNGNGFRMKGEATLASAMRRFPVQLAGSLAFEDWITQCGDDAPPARCSALQTHS